MPKIKITRSCVCNGEHAEAGEVVDASAEDATYLIGLGKAVPAGKAPKAESREADAEESISKRMK